MCVCVYLYFFALCVYLWHFLGPLSVLVSSRRCVNMTGHEKAEELKKILTQTVLLQRHLATPMCSIAHTFLLRTHTRRHTHTHTHTHRQTHRQTDTHTHTQRHTHRHTRRHTFSFSPTTRTHPFLPVRAHPVLNSLICLQFQHLI